MREAYDGLDPNKFIEINGQIWERDVLGVVAEIQRRWPNVSVQYLDPELIKLDLYDAPFQICERLSNGELRVIQQVWQLDGRVIEMLEQANQYGPNWSAVVARFEREIANARNARQRDHEDRMDNAEEITYNVAASVKDTYTVRDEVTGKKLKFRSTQPVEVIDVAE